MTHRWRVEWDGDEVGKRAVAHWAAYENAMAHFERKRKAGSNPSLHENPGWNAHLISNNIEAELANRQLTSQP